MPDMANSRKYKNNGYIFDLGYCELTFLVVQDPLLKVLLFQLTVKQLMAALRLLESITQLLGVPVIVLRNGYTLGSITLGLL